MYDAPAPYLIPGPTTARQRARPVAAGGVVFFVLYITAEQLIAALLGGERGRYGRLLTPTWFVGSFVGAALSYFTAYSVASKIAHNFSKRLLSNIAAWPLAAVCLVAGLLLLDGIGRVPDGRVLAAVLALAFLAAFGGVVVSAERCAAADKARLRRPRDPFKPNDFSGELFTIDAFRERLKIYSCDSDNGMGYWATSKGYWYSPETRRPVSLTPYDLAALRAGERPPQPFFSHVIYIHGK